MAIRHQKNPGRCISFSLPHNDYIDSQIDEFAISASSVVRKALDFYIQYAVKPDIMARVLAEAKREEAEAAAVEAAASARRAAKRRFGRKIAA